MTASDRGLRVDAETALSVDLASVGTLGKGLRRPECVLSTRRGDLYVAHLDHGVLHIAPDGAQRAIGAVSEIDGRRWIPNGIALQVDGSFLVANMGESGGLWRLDRTGAVEPVLREVDGLTLTATNFVTIDAVGRIWVTVTTRHWPISEAFTPLGSAEVADGYLVVIDDRGTRIVADGLAFANEARPDAKGEFLYVVETFGRRISRFRIGKDARLSGREVFVSFGHGTFPDGFAFDALGHLWVASIVSNRLIRVSPDGDQRVVVAEEDPAFIDRIEQRIAAGSLGREDIQRTPSRVLRNIASVTFGGSDLRTLYLGSLGGDTLAVLRSPVPGQVPIHWDW